MGQYTEVAATVLELDEVRLGARAGTSKRDMPRVHNRRATNGMEWNEANDGRGHEGPVLGSGAILTTECSSQLEQRVRS